MVYVEHMFGMHKADVHFISCTYILYVHAYVRRWFDLRVHCSCVHNIIKKKSVCTYVRIHAYVVHMRFIVICAVNIHLVYNLCMQCMCDFCFCLLLFLELGLTWQCL